VALHDPDEEGFAGGVDDLAAAPPGWFVNPVSVKRLAGDRSADIK
jgi:hypothetical protein